MKLLKKIKPRIQFKKPEQSDTWSCYYCKATVDNGKAHKCGKRLSVKDICSVFNVDPELVKKDLSPGTYTCMERYFREAKGRAPKRDK